MHFTEKMDAYERTAGMWIVGEDMPQESNRITLNTARQGPARPAGAERALRRPPERRRDAQARIRRADLLYEAVGALSVHHTPPYPSTHNLGTCRMSDRPEDGVVDRYGKAHDVPNLFVCDGR